MLPAALPPSHRYHCPCCRPPLAQQGPQGAAAAPGARRVCCLPGPAVKRGRTHVVEIEPPELTAGPRLGAGLREVPRTAACCSLKHTSCRRTLHSGSPLTRSWPLSSGRVPSSTLMPGWGAFEGRGVGHELVVPAGPPAAAAPAAGSRRSASASLSTGDAAPRIECGARTAPSSQMSRIILVNEQQQLDERLGEHWREPEGGRWPGDFKTVNEIN